MSRNAICAVSTDSTTACLGRFGFGAGLTPITSARTRGIATSKSVYGRAPRSPMHMCEKHDKHLSAQVPTKYRLLQYATTESHSQSPICGAGALTELTTVTAGMRSSRPNGSMLTGRSRNANVLRPAHGSASRHVRRGISIWLIALPFFRAHLLLPKLLCLESVFRPMAIRYAPTPTDH
mgnify:CR=1 FL=1